LDNKELINHAHAAEATKIALQGQLTHFLLEALRFKESLKRENRLTDQNAASISRPTATIVVEISTPKSRVQSPKRFFFALNIINYANCIRKWKVLVPSNTSSSGSTKLYHNRFFIVTDDCCWLAR